MAINLSPWLRMAAKLETQPLPHMARAADFHLHGVSIRAPLGLPPDAILFAGFSAASQARLWLGLRHRPNDVASLIMLGLLALRERRWLFALPLVLVLPRIALQYQAQLKGALRGIL